MNNVDAALAPEPKCDPWDDHEEPTEDAGRAKGLTWGRGADDHFAAAHAAAEALRKRRRQQRAQPGRPEQGPMAPTRAGKERVGWCDECNRYVVADGLHHCVVGNGWRGGHATDVVAENPLTNTDEFDFDATMQKLNSKERCDYYHVLEVIKRVNKGKRKQRLDIPAEWREPLAYPGYLLHSVSRELRRVERTITLPNGATRRYPAKLVKPHNGAYSLSINGVKSSRGVNALWSETFPEYARKSKGGGARLDHENYGRNLPGRWDGTGEWIGDGGVGITMRPK